MAKPYNFESPIVTENGLEEVASVIKANFVKKEEGKSLVSDTDITQITTNKTDIATIKTQLTGIETTLAGLNTRMGAVV